MKDKPMTHQASISSNKKKKKDTGYQVWHFVLAVPALAITLQLFLGSLTPLPDEHNPYTTRYVSGFPSEYNSLYNDSYYLEEHYKRMPEIEILPLNLRGEMTGPLLASVIQEYFPESTTEQASTLRDSLPPCDDPRMIVILPKGEDEPVF
ncbi:MAG: hypothetical protein AAGB26_10420 [Planctomycetota bacterium]